MRYMRTSAPGRCTDAVVKRGGPIRRKTPMKSGSSLRSTPPAQGSGKPAAPRRTGKHVGENAAKDAVRERSGGDCEIRSPWCQGRGREFSHRRAEGQGGEWSPRNGLFVCGHGNVDGCHGYAHQHPEEARDSGWIVSAFGADPAGVQVLMWHKGRCDWFLLRNEDPWVDLAPWPEGKTGHPDDLELPKDKEGLGGAA